MDELLTVDQAADALGLDPTTLRRRIRRGDMVAHRIGRDWLIPAEELLRDGVAARMKPGPKPRAEVERQRALGPLKRGRRGKQE